MLARFSGSKHGPTTILSQLYYHAAPHFLISLRQECLEDDDVLLVSRCRFVKSFPVRHSRDTIYLPLYNAPPRSAKVGSPGPHLVAAHQQPPQMHWEKDHDHSASKRYKISFRLQFARFVLHDELERFGTPRRQIRTEFHREVLEVSTGLGGVSANYSSLFLQLDEKLGATPS